MNKDYLKMWVDQVCLDVQRRAAAMSGTCVSVNDIPGKSEFLKIDIKKQKIKQQGEILSWD